MKKSLFAVLAVLCMLESVSVFAEESTQKENVSFPWSIYVQTDLCYSPECRMLTGDTHYAPITGIYASFLCRSTIHADYTLNTPLGEHWLLSDANLIAGAAFELTPVSIKPYVYLSFTPLPFLEFHASAHAGTAWSFFGKNGMEKYNADSGEYEALTFGKDWYLKASAGATFQFDTGAIWEGDWTHVVTLATYTLSYTTITGVKNKTPWSWQAISHYMNGLNYDWYFVLGYRLPYKLNIVGVGLELYGYYDGQFDPAYEKFDGTFMTAELSPLAAMVLDEKNSFNMQFTFKTRRSFLEEHENSETSKELLLTKTGTEWFFDSFAFRWTHKF